MPRPQLNRSTLAAVLPVIGLIAMLLALAFLQLCWSVRVSEAEQERLEQYLAHATRGFQSAFAQELLGLSQTLQAAQLRPPSVLIDHLSDRYLVWSRIGGHAALVDRLDIWQPPGRLLRLDPVTRRLEAAAASDPLQSFGPNTRVEPAPDAWTWNEPKAALIHPLYTQTSSSAHPQLYGYLLVALDVRNFEQLYLPALGRRYFPAVNGFVFELVQQNADSPQAVFSSLPGENMYRHSDAVFPLLDGDALYRSSAAAHAVPNAVILSSSGGVRWQVAVRHRSGSLAVAVRDLRRRNLAISLVVLLLLVISLILILRATRRARRLGRLQMEFASGVSHELRTPLAVIRSAAENLADGVITETSRVREYGMLIHQESQHLSGMVDHILDFARMDLGGHHSAAQEEYETVSVTDIVERVLRQLQTQMESRGATVELRVGSDLPSFRTRPKILGQCLENLIGNSLKYAGPHPGVILDVSRATESGREFLLFCVQDNGPGIPPQEIPHIYEPFYRGRHARESRARGAGLGLSLTRRMMEELGGRITLESTPGKGSAFTLHVPAGAPLA